MVERLQPVLQLLHLDLLQLHVPLHLRDGRVESVPSTLVLHLLYVLVHHEVDREARLPSGGITQNDHLVGLLVVRGRVLSLQAPISRCRSRRTRREAATEAGARGVRDEVPCAAGLGLQVLGSTAYGRCVGGVAT